MAMQKSSSNILEQQPGHSIYLVDHSGDFLKVVLEWSPDKQQWRSQDESFNLMVVFQVSKLCFPSKVPRKDCKNRDEEGKILHETSYILGRILHADKRLEFRIMESSNPSKLLELERAILLWGCLSKRGNHPHPMNFEIESVQLTF